MENNKAQITIQKRIDTNQQLLLDQLKKTPIIETACQKIGIGRASYYRWRKSNEEFAKLADVAITEGTLLINDLAENQLIGAISNSNLGAIIFWLRNRHPAYTNKVEITTPHNEQLTKEEQAAVEKALILTGIKELPATEKRKEDASGNI